MKRQILEMVGWYGTIAIIGAYAMTSFSLITPDNLVYQLLNLTGAIGIVAISFYKKTYQPGVLNIIWAVVASFAILNIILSK